MKSTVSGVVSFLEKLAPFELAESWDNVGLLAGDEQAVCTGVVVAVNLGAEALAAAKKNGANLIVCHHPPIFKAAKKITAATHPYLHQALRSSIAVVALHTNFDLSSKELSSKLALKLGFQFQSFLASREGEHSKRTPRQYKFVTFAPVNAVKGIRNAAAAAGAGQIGNYTHCSFSSKGVGSFLGNEKSNPKVGKKQRLTSVEECRIEMVLPAARARAVVSAVRRAHPYEEMAYDLIEIASEAADVGYGFVAEAKSAVPAKELLSRIKKVFAVGEVTIAGPAFDSLSAKIKKLAFSPGSGSSFVSAAASSGVQAYLCGEVGYHQMLEARARGMSLMLIGHSYSECFFVQTVASWCSQFGRKALSVEKVFEKIHKTV